MKIMIKSDGTGTIPNITNFDKLVSHATGLGTSYNPANPLLKVTALSSQLAVMQTSQTTLDDAFSDLTTARNQRKVAFAPLGALATRIQNAVIASTTSEQTDESVKSLVRKIKGERATPLKSKEKLAAEGQTPEETHSASQLGYDDQVDNFQKLVSLLKKTPDYKPNEADLKVEALEAYQAELALKNKAVIDSEILENNTRNERDELMDKPTTGLVDVASDVKNYIKSVFGASSVQYRAISGLKFTHKRS
jgi:hypothetical protein